MQIQGNIVKVFEPRSGTSSSGKQWCSLDFVLEIPGPYPRRVVLNIFGEERIKTLAPKVGEVNVVVDFDIDAHEYNGRFYNEIKAWNITRTVQQNAASVTAALQGAANPMNPQNPFPPQQQPAAQASSQSSDELPF